MGLFKTRFTQRWIFLGVLGALTACGGGGGGSSSVPALSSVGVSSSLTSSNAESSIPTSSVGLSLSSSSEQLSSSSSAVSILPFNRTPAHAHWTFNAKSKVRSTAVTTDTAVIFGTDGGVLYALDLETGKERWQLDSGGGISSHLLMADGKIIFLNFSGKIMAVDAETGTQVWSKTTTGEHLREWGHHLASAIQDGDRVYIGSSSGKVYGLALSSGEEVWSVDLKSPIHTQVAILDGRLYISSDTAVHSIDIATKNQFWSLSLNNPTSPAVANGKLIVGHRHNSNNNVHGIDVSTGSIQWSIPHAQDWVTGDPVIVNDIAYIGSSDDMTYQSINIHTGKLNWSVSTGANVFSKPAFNGEVSYISSGNVYPERKYKGRLLAINIQGQLIWEFKEKDFYSSPVVKNDRIYIGSDDGYFYAMPAL